MDRDRRVSQALVDPVVRRNHLKVDYVLEIPTDDEAAVADGRHRDVQRISVPFRADNSGVQIRPAQADGVIARIHHFGDGLSVGDECPDVFGSLHNFRTNQRRENQSEPPLPHQLEECAARDRKLLVEYAAVDGRVGVDANGLSSSRGHFQGIVREEAADAPQRHEGWCVPAT